jgi:hypothetical protein
LYLTCRFLVFGDIGTTINVDDVEIIYNSSQMSLDEKNSLNLVIYPNPASENIQITFEALNEDYTISILDLQGRVLQTQAYSNLTGAQNINFKLIDLKSGKYLVKIESNKTTVSKMIVVE